ncbi:hypothetical protein [Clostridium sp.]|uniref:hypothetical protein n=1 Tax=Clostridium sp. TaxID=1506 RepID=UPI002FC67882
MNFGLGLQGRTMISSKDIDSLINSINSKVDGIDNINLIMQQYGLFKSQGNKYFMSSEVNKSFANLKDILSLTESISEGSDENRHVDIIDIPFGANNYLNKAFKEKGINLELSQVSSNTVSAIKDRINYLKDLIDLLKDADIKNKGAVITTEKKIGIKHSEFKIKTIQALLESPNTSQELKDKLKELDFTISRLEDITTDDDYIQVSSNYRNIILQFEREFFNYWSSLDDVKKVDFIKNITTVFNKNLIYDTGALSADIISEEGEILNDSTSYMYLLSCSFGNSDIVTKEYKDSIQNSNMFPFDSQEDIILTVSKFLLRDSKDDIKL